MASRRSAARGRDESARARDESGGAATLWVVLMVPIAAYAASVALAGPQRLAAESSIKETADDLATLAVAWRDGQGTSDGDVSGFPLDCAQSLSDQQEVAELRLDAGLELDPVRVDELLAEADAKEQQTLAFVARCELFHEAIVRDLGNLGVDMGSIEGFYSDSLAAASGDDLPCAWSPTLEVRDAVHVAVAGEWKDANWAAAQVWPDGVRVGAESIGRLVRETAPRDAGETSAGCGTGLDPTDEWGQARWISGDDSARTLTQSSPTRTGF